MKRAKGAISSSRVDCDLIAVLAWPAPQAAVKVLCSRHCFAAFASSSLR